MKNQRNQGNAGTALAALLPLALGPQSVTPNQGVHSGQQTAGPAKIGGKTPLGKVQMRITDDADLVYNAETHAWQLTGEPFEFTSIWPDLPARAVRVGGTTQLLITHGALWKPPSGGKVYTGGTIRLFGDGSDPPNFFLDPDSALVPECVAPPSLPPPCLPFTSTGDGVPCHFNDHEWLAAVFYDEATETVHAIVHNEDERHSFDYGELRASTCEVCDDLAPNCCNGLDVELDVQTFEDAERHCQTTNLTRAWSTDGGAHYVQEPIIGADETAELVAHGPYIFEPEPGPTVCGLDIPKGSPDHYYVLCPFMSSPYGGYLEPSNILQSPIDDLYYMIVKQFLPPRFKKACRDMGQPCYLWERTPTITMPHSIVMRTHDLSNANTWTAWGGLMEHGDPIFDVDLLNPYVEGEPSWPFDHVGHPLNPYWDDEETPNTTTSASASVTWNSFLGKFVIVDRGFVVETDIGGDEILGKWAIFFSVSDDLVTWSPRRLTDPPIYVEADARPLHPSLIDHDSLRPNFDWTDRDAHLYYQVKAPGPSAGKGDLMRVPVRFDVL